MATERGIVMVPFKAEDCFFQKCCMESSLIENMEASLGDFILIETPECSSICVLWPSQNLSKDSVLYSQMVCKPKPYNTDSGYPSSQLSQQMQEGKNRSRMKTLSVCKAASVHVTVIIKDIHKMNKFKAAQQNERLQTQCLNCLNRLCIADGFYVNCSTIRLARVYGIDGFEVHSVVPAKTSGKYFDACVVRTGTEIIVDAVHSKDWFEQKQTRNHYKLSQLGGLDDVLSSLTDLIKIPLQHKEHCSTLGIDPPQGILLRGPPGCGKTSLVKHCAASCNAFLLTVNGPEVYGPHPGETEANLRSIFQNSKLFSTEGPCILFFDEVDSICPRSGRQSGIQESRVTGQFLTLLDGVNSHPNLVVIAATNRASALDPSVRRPGRLDREILISVPTCWQRREILSNLLPCLPLGTDVNIDDLADMTVGYVGADLMSLCQEAAYLAMSDTTNSGQSVNQVRQSHLLTAVRKICPSLQKGAEGVVDLRPVHWNQIGGLEDVKAQIKQAVEWPIQHPEAFSRMGLSCPKGVLLYGPPGCCKTTLVRAAATACHATFLSLSGAQLYSPYVGDSEKLISEVFQRARASAPAIVFLDEIDSIVGKRSESSHHGVQDRILSVLLNEMDGIGIKLDDKTDRSIRQKEMEGQIHRHKTEQQSSDVSVRRKIGSDHRSLLVVAATNRPDLLDEALIRPGRIDRIVYVPQPDVKARLEILKVFTQKMKLEEVNLETIAESTDMYTGADLENLCREAALAALTESLDASQVTSSHFTKALNSVKPFLTPQLLQQYSNVNASTFKKKMK